MTKRETEELTRNFCSVVDSVNGITAAELEVENANNSTSRNSPRNLKGLQRVITMIMPR